MNPNWTNRKKVLTKAEMKHLTKGADCRTKQQFQNTINTHEKQRKENPKNPDPCWDCRFIAKKLNMKAEV